MNKALSLLSLAQKAGQVVSGEFSVEKGLKEGNVCLCIVAEDASGNTKKKFNNMCTFRSVKLIEFSNKEELGHMIGKRFRATIGITDQGFADNLLKKIDDHV